MSEDRETAYAKVNLALHVRERMADGYHRIETLFAFCEDGDALSAEPADAISLSIGGHFAPGLEIEDNLVVKAARALARRGGTDCGARLVLTKSLPVAAGIGGGSADAAATLRLLNRIWKLDLSLAELEAIGRELGADVAACVRSEPALGEGRGDNLTSADIGLSGRPLLLINPRVELSTAEVFAAWDGQDRGQLDDWRHGRNDLEAVATAMAPQIGSVLAWLSAQRGAECVRMSGSGATCFALFANDVDLDRAAVAVPREWWQLATRLR